MPAGVGAFKLNSARLQAASAWFPSLKRMVFKPEAALNARGYLLHFPSVSDISDIENLTFSISTFS